MSVSTGYGGFPTDYENAAQQRQGLLDVRQVARALGRRKWWILAPTVLAFGLSLAAVNSITPRYTGETRILLESQNDFLRRPDKDQRGSEPTIDQDAVQSQVQLLNSRDIARSVIKTLGLIGNAEFDPSLGEFGPMKRALVLLGLSKSPAQSSPEDRVLERYYERLQAYSVRGSRVLVVEFSSRDPELAAKGASAVAAAYIAEQERAKQSNSRSAGAWLNGVIEPLRTRLAQKETDIETYRSGAGLFVGANNTTMANQQLSELNTQLASARAQQAELFAKATILRGALKSNKLFEVSDIANNELIRNLSRDRSTLRAQIAQEERTLLPSHPQMKALYAQVEGLEQQIRNAADRASKALENDSRTAGARVASLQGELDEQKKLATASNDADVKLRALEREAKSMRDQLESFMLKYNEAASRDADNAAPADARVISSAVVPDTPSFPKKLPIILVATLAALLVSAAIVATRELMTARASSGPRDPLRSEREEPWIEPATEAHSGAVGHTPRFPAFGAAAAQREDSGGRLADSSYADALEGVLGRVRAVKPSARGALVSIVHAASAGDAHRTALELARALGRDSRAILVDLDPGVGALNPLVAESHPRGLTDVLASRASLREAIHRDRASPLHLMPMGQDGRPDVLRDERSRLETVTAALLQTYDFALVEAGAVRTAPDVALAGADLVLLVAQGDERDPETVAAYLLAKERGAAMVSVVLTPSDEAVLEDAPAVAA